MQGDAVKLREEIANIAKGMEGLVCDFEVHRVERKSGKKLMRKDMSMVFPVGTAKSSILFALEKILLPIWTQYNMARRPICRTVILSRSMNFMSDAYSLVPDELYAYAVRILGVEGQFTWGRKKGLMGAREDGLELRDIVLDWDETIPLCLNLRFSR